MSIITARIAAASGAIYVVTVLVGGALMSSSDVVLSRFGYALAVLGFTAFVVFLGFVHRLLRHAEGPDGWLATVALAAGVLHSAVRFEAQAPRMVASFRGDELSPELAGVLVDLNGMAFVVTGLLLGLYCASAGAVCVAHRLLPRWLGWFGVVSGVLALAAGTVGMVDPASYLPVPFLAGLLWTLIASVLLAARPFGWTTARATAPIHVPNGVAVAE
jgi:hypothetical protein